jgi:hypothetical protein
VTTTREQIYLEITAQIDGRVQQGSTLYLVSSGDPATNDKFGNPGTSDLYLNERINPDENGCWTYGRVKQGYEGFCGITVRFVLMLMSTRQADELEYRRAHERDIYENGFPEDQIRPPQVFRLAHFDVPTAPCRASVRPVRCVHVPP